MPKSHVRTAATRNLATVLGVSHQEASRLAMQEPEPVDDLCPYCGVDTSWYTPGDDHCCECGAISDRLEYACVCPAPDYTPAQVAAFSERWQHVEPKAKTLSSALAAVERGFHIFPVPAGVKRANPGWHDQVTGDADVVAATWPDGANVGVACAPSGLVVLDLDTATGDEQASGIWTLERLAYQVNDGWGDVLNTYTVRTPSDGMHLYFRVPDSVQVRSVSSWMPGIDVRGNAGHGGYVLAAGSQIPDPRPTWPARPRWYDETYRIQPVAVLPDWLLKLLTVPTGNTAADTVRGTRYRPDPPARV